MGTDRAAAARLRALRDPNRAARRAGLHYVRDTDPGIERRRRAGGFAYFNSQGAPVKDAATLARIRALAIPPAWTQVWICRDPQGHLQATGRDARGRKQSRYHPRWREVRDQTKYERLRHFGEALPRIRRQVERDLRRRGLPAEKVLATIVALMERTLLRVGNEEYARANRHFGLTTLRERHVEIAGADIRFQFLGKSGKMRSVGLHDRRLARILQRCCELPGYELFHYVGEDGRVHRVDSADVNRYLRAISGSDFTAKDFRTWAGTVMAGLALGGLPPFRTQGEARRNVVRAIEAVAGRLGNTATVCRKCYVHPLVIEQYLARPPAAAAEKLGLQEEAKLLVELEEQALRQGERDLLALLGGRAAA